MLLQRNDIGHKVQVIKHYDAFELLIIYIMTVKLSVDIKPLYIKKLQAIHLMLYKRWCKTAKIKKYKHKLMY